MSGSLNKSERPETSWLQAAADTRKSNHLERTLREYVNTPEDPQSPPCLNFASNDYLNLAHHPQVVARAQEALAHYGASASASRLVTGTLPIHTELERRLAELKGHETALVFGSGYMATAGVIPAMVSRDDTVFADRLSHASILDAVTLSRAKLVRFDHNDMTSLEDRLTAAPQKGRRLIVTESVFSMDGDLAPIESISHLANTHHAMLMIDEAHATGVFGKAGCGRVGPHAQHITVSMGTLSKALGGYGGFIATSRDLAEHVFNTARSFIYTTAAAPASIGAALGALEVLENEPELGATLLTRAHRFRHTLNEAGLSTGQSESQIIPLEVGHADQAMCLSTRLEQNGILAIAIRPPTVPKGTSRIRLALSLRHSESQLDEAAQIIIRCAQEEGLL